MSAPHMPMMNDEGLLDCPFCGGSPYEDSNEYDYSIGYYVACKQCGCGTDEWPRQASAVKAWNTRNGHLYTAGDFNQAAEERDHGL